MVSEIIKVDFKKRMLHIGKNGDKKYTKLEIIVNEINLVTVEIVEIKPD